MSPRGSASASGPTAGTTNASPNLVECFFSIITREAIRRGSFTSVRELTGPAGAFIDSWNDHPARLPGPRTPAGILANVERAKTGQALLYTMSDVRSHAPHDTGRDIIQAHMLAGPSEVSAKVGVLMRIPETMTDPLLRSLRLYTHHVPLTVSLGKEFITERLLAALQTRPPERFATTRAGPEFRIDTNDVFIDVGADIGYFPIFTSRLVSNHGHQNSATSPVRGWVPNITKKHDLPQMLPSPCQPATARTLLTWRNKMITLITTPDTRASSPEQICVIIPVFGEQHLTDAVIKDLVDGGHPCAIYVVDNRGDYRPSGVEYVLQTDSNRHWAGGCNLGLSIAKERGHAAYVLLNNDVRLSKRFLAGISAAWSDTGACLIGPAYDHNWPQQRTVYTGLARQYKPRDVDRLVPFVDGTCFFIPHRVLESVGLLDERTWPRYGWGCDKDYALRVRQSGGEVRATERAYLNHLGRQTAAKASWYDEREAEEENNAGMSAKWGPNWRDVLYAGFDGLSRDGLVQLRLLRSDQEEAQGNAS